MRRPRRSGWELVKWTFTNLFERRDPPLPPPCEPGTHVPVPGNAGTCIKCGRSMW